MAVVTSDSTHSRDESRHGERDKSHLDEEDSYDEEDEEAVDEESDDESDEEDIDDWDTLIPLDELENMEDGPSTYYVGGFAVCPSLSEALSAVHYTQDRILIFPGLHDGTRRVISNAAHATPSGTTPSAASESNTVETIVLDETRLGGLKILSVPFARGRAGGYAGHYFTHHTASFTSSSLLSSAPYRADAEASGGAMHSYRTRDERDYEANENEEGRGDAHAAVRERDCEALFYADGRSRVGPWFDYVAAASLHTTHAGSGALVSTASSTAAPSSAVTAAQLYANWITPTEMSITHCPVLVSRLVLRYGDVERHAATAAERNSRTEGLVEYQQDYTGDDDYEKDGDVENEEENEEEDGAHEEGHRRGGRDAALQERAWGGYPPHAIMLAGLVVLHGMECGPLTRSVVQHCVLGLGSVAMTDGHRRQKEEEGGMRQSR